MSKVAYLGIQGSFSHQAVKSYFSEEYDFIGFSSFLDIFDSIENGKCEYGIVPIENSLAGSVYDNYDLLYKKNISVIGEKYIQIRHCLIGFSEKISDIKTVSSHYKALEQCKNFFNENKNIKKEIAQDTATAVENVSKLNDKTICAIGSCESAKIYNVPIILQNIEDNDNNYTRFFIISAKRKPDLISNKCSLIFTLKHESGSLYKALGIFASHNINILKIESRPLAHKPFEYIFYLDIEWNKELCNDIVNYIDEFKKYTESIRILGFYCSDDLKIEKQEENLEVFRNEIDFIDKQIVNLLENRLSVTDKVASYKNKNNLPLRDYDREKRLFESLSDNTNNIILKNKLHTIYEIVLEMTNKKRMLHYKNDMQFSSIGIIGLGFIGGSIAKALKEKYPSISIETLKRDNSSDIEKAYKTKNIAKVHESLQDLISSVDLIILATPINTISKFIKEISLLKKNKKCIIIDIASIKSDIALDCLACTNDTFEFIATHPMAGSEKTGFENANPIAFVRQPWIITPHEKNTEESLSKIYNLILSFGSEVYTMTPNQHDEYISRVSHLVFIVSTMLYAFIQKKYPENLKLAGSGFISTTRLASADPKLHYEIFTHNNANIQESIKEFIAFFEKFPFENLLYFFSEIKANRDSLIRERENYLFKS